MQIELKSNRKFIFNIMLPGIIVISIGVLFFAIAMIIEYEPEFFLPLIIFSVIDAVYILIAIIAKLKKRPSFYFNKNEIVTNKNNNKTKIKIENVEFMHYYPFRWYYIFTIFLGALNEGGAMKIHIKEKNGQKHELGFISEKDALRLKEMYPNLLTIYYSEKNRISN